MADIFLSYASGDRVKAGALASLLQTGGWSVWWDRDIKGGEEWSARIEHELETARCVVVLWTRRSIASQWVLREARSARSRQIILPVLLEPVTPPEELAEVHATPLTAWIGEERSFELRPFLERLANFLGGEPPSIGDPPIADAITKLSRVEVAEATFDFCAARLQFFRLKDGHLGVPDDILEQIRDTYDKLCEILAPVSSDDVHALICFYENAFTPQAPWCQQD